MLLCCVFPGFPLLSFKVSQELQDEAQSSQDEVDQSIQSRTRQRTHSQPATPTQHAALSRPRNANCVLTLLCVVVLLCACVCQSDSTFEFERRRHVPIRYDRELMSTTIRAMQRVSEIRNARQERVHTARMRVKQRVERQADKRELKQNAELIRAPLMSAERRSMLNAIRERSTKLGAGQGRERVENGGGARRAVGMEEEAADVGDGDE